MTGKMFKMCAVCAVVAGLTALSNHRASAAVNYRTVVIAGDAAPGTEVGITFNRFSGSALNQNGQVAFHSHLTGEGIDSTNDLGIWSESGGSLGLIARNNSTAPGTPQGVVFNSFYTSSLLINGAGQIIFGGTLRGEGVNDTNNTGIWSESSGSLNLVAQTGDTVPDAGPGVIFSEFNRFVDTAMSNNVGQITFSASITDPSDVSTNRMGLLSGVSGSLNLVAQTGTAAPGAEPEETYRGFGAPSINELGQKTFIASLQGASVNNTNDVGVWADVSGSMSLVVREGEAAPGTGQGVVYINNFGLRPTLNNAGQIAFKASLSGPGIDDSNHTGIWLHNAGSSELVVQEGEAAPETGPGVVFGGVGDPVLNEIGNLTFASRLDGPSINTTNDVGIWLVKDGTLNLIAREGNHAPGTPDGVVFGRVDNISTANPFGSVVLNNAGQMAIWSRLIGPGVDNTNDRGLWIVDSNSEFTLIARTGDVIDVNDDPLIEDLRTISPRSITYKSGSGGRGTGFNDAGQLLFQAGFTDGTSGIFVATIPEPASLTLFIVGSALALHRGHRRGRATHAVQPPI